MNKFKAKKKARKHTKQAQQRSPEQRELDRQLLEWIGADIWYTNETR